MKKNVLLTFLVILLICPIFVQVNIAMFKDGEPKNVACVSEKSIEGKS
jgi:hypothetical protein